MTSERDSSLISPDALSDLRQRPNFIALGLDPRTGEQNSTLNALGFDFERSTADDILNAHRGYQLAFHTEQAGRVVRGTYTYYAASVDGRHYLPIGDGERFVVASRLQIGGVNPVGVDQTVVSFSKKSLLRGATGIRGWGVQSHS